MNKSDSLWKNWKEMVYCMEMELQAQAELIVTKRTGSGTENCTGHFF